MLAITQIIMDLNSLKYSDTPEYQKHKLILYSYFSSLYMATSPIAIISDLHFSYFRNRNLYELTMHENTEAMLEEKLQVQYSFTL